MKKFLKKNRLKIIGILFGGIAGFAYYYITGCSTGTCPITSNPYISILWGTVMGYLVAELFKKKKHETN